jgi:hypothetical protein
MFDHNNGGPLSAEECYDGFANNFGINYGYYHGGAAPFVVMFTPFNAVINLKTGILVKRDTMADYFQNAQQIITLMQQTDQ